MKSKVISLSAISAAFIGILLTIGAYVEILDVFCIVIASFIVILPLYYNSYWASILTFLVGGVISLIFSGFNFLSIVFPAYFSFFGCYPILRICLLKKNFNKLVTYLIGFFWCTVAIGFLYFYYTNIMGLALQNLPKFVNDFLVVFLIVISVIVYFVFDRCIILTKMVSDKYLGRILK